MGELPKAFIRRSRGNLVDLKKTDEVVRLTHEIEAMLARPAMWVGSSTNFDSFCTLFYSKISDLTYFCGARSASDFLDDEKFGSLGLHKFVNEAKEKSDGWFYAQLSNLYYHRLRTWIPSNLMIYSADVYLPEFNSESCKSPSTHDLAKLPIIKKHRKALKSTLEKCEADSSHVYASTYWRGGWQFHINITALNRPVNQDHSNAKYAREIGLIGDL